LVVRDVAEVFSENPCARGKAWRTLTDGVSSCRTDRAVVVRILVNMVKNAYEASEPGDEVVLEAVSRGAGVRFTVTNSAVMAPEVAVHVFERSFTTKEIPGRGLGTYAMRLLAEGVD
jgi:signal transduction histidine kinase